MYDDLNRIKIAFLTSMDARDKRAWSGILHYTAKALQEHCGEVFYITSANLEKKQGKRLFYKRLRVFIKKYFAYAPLFSIGRKYFVCDYRIFSAKKFAKEANLWLAKNSFDVIVAPASTTEIAFVETDVPIVLVEDATFASLHNYYPQYSSLPKGVVCRMNKLADKAIKKASMLVYASSWAARSAVEEYHADQQKVHVVPMGANFDSPPAREVVERRKKSDRCRLLFVGFDWQRKGGDIAFETLLELEKRGIQAELVVCGCIPPKHISHRMVKVIPFLDKNDARQYEELEQLYVTSDFLLLPTRNECYGIVFCEANAFGLPVITTSTGGVPEVVRDNENGFVLPFSARGAEYAEVIAEIYQDDQRYAELVRSSRAAFDNRLNWGVWGISMKNLLNGLLKL